MKRTPDFAITTALVTYLLVFAVSQAFADDSKRPYEMVWAGRTVDENGPALVSFNDPRGWTVETENAVASIVRATDRELFGEGVTRLTYRADGTNGAPCVTMRPPAPIAVSGAVDTVSCWIYGNNIYG